MRGWLAEKFRKLGDQTRRTLAFAALAYCTAFGATGAVLVFTGVPARMSDVGDAVLIPIGVAFLIAARRMYRWGVRNTTSGDRFYFGLLCLAGAGLMAWALPQDRPDMGLWPALAVAIPYGLWGAYLVRAEIRLWLDSRNPPAGGGAA